MLDEPHDTAGKTRDMGLLRRHIVGKMNGAVTDANGNIHNMQVIVKFYICIMYIPIYISNNF